MYGLSNEDTNLFISSLEEYDKYLDDDQINKTNSVYNIQMILIKMILLKNLYKGLSIEELEFYDNHLLLKDQKIRNKELAYLMVVLDKYINLDKPQMLAKIYLSYLNGEIIWNEVMKYSEVIDRLLPGDIELLAVGMRENVN